jgi:hypothetical protein
MSCRRFSASPGSTVRLRAKFYDNGVLTDPDSFPSDVGIYLVPSGGSPLATVTPAREALGIYYVDYTLPTTFASNNLYDEWTWIGDAGMSPNVQRYLSEIELIPTPDPPPTEFIKSPTDAVGYIFRAVTPTTTEIPKSGFTVKAVPRSVVESVSSQSHDRLKTITKSAIEQYIRSFLDTTGKNRSAIESVAKGSLQYITDKSIEATEDKTKRATQLARLYNEVRERLPAILIVDAGTEHVPSGMFSGLTHSTLLEGKWQGWFNKQLKVPLTISVLTGDQDSTDQLMEIVLLAFTNLRQIAGGSEIRSRRSEDQWAVRIPLMLTISANSGANITEDTKDQIWFSNFDIPVEAEDTFAIEMPFDTSLDPDDYAWDTSQGGVISEANLSAKLPPEILAPSTIQINSPTTVGFRRIRHTHKIVIDQPMVATFDPETRVITPRSLGTFTLMVVDLGTRSDDQGPRALAPVVAAQKAITVTL